MQLIDGRSPIAFPWLDWEIDPPAGFALDL